jgi:hypothetical protein
MADALPAAVISAVLPASRPLMIVIPFLAMAVAPAPDRREGLYGTLCRQELVLPLDQFPMRD